MAIYQNNKADWFRDVSTPCDMYVLLPKCLMYTASYYFMTLGAQCVLQCNGKYACWLTKVVSVDALARCVTRKLIKRSSECQIGNNISVLCCDFD